MKLLGFDLSTRRGTIALVNGGKILCARDCPNDRRNSAPFFAALDEIIGGHGAPDAIVVGLGPGSYTGTRIAISAAIGLQATTGAALTGLIPQRHLGGKRIHCDRGRETRVIFLRRGWRGFVCYRARPAFSKRNE